MSVTEGELNSTDLFAFIESLVFESVFYKGTLKIPLLFEIVLRLYQVKMKGDLISHIIHIAGERTIEAFIYGLYRGNNLGGIMRGINQL